MIQEMEIINRPDIFKSFTLEWKEKWTLAILMYARKLIEETLLLLPKSVMTEKVFKYAYKLHVHKLWLFYSHLNKTECNGYITIFRLLLYSSSQIIQTKYNSYVWSIWKYVRPYFSYEHSE